MANRAATGSRPAAAAGTAPATIKYLGSYEASYARHRVLQKGLNALGVTVDEVWDRSFLPWRWFRLIAAAWGTPAGVPVVVGEAGNYLTPVLWLAGLGRRRVVFDTFISLKDTAEDRGGRLSFLKAWVGWLVDRMNCAAADVVLVDTREMAAYFRREIGVEPSKIHVVYLGAETDLFIPQSDRSSAPGRLEVLFYGTFIPLHGVGVILRAAAILQVSHPGVEFTIVGFGQEYARMLALSRDLELQNVRFWRRHVPYDELPALISKADVCLGIFADRPKTSRVIPHKVFQAAASGRAVVTADTPAIREVFSTEEMILVEPGSPESLASHLAVLAADPMARRRVAERGMEVVRNRHNPARAAEQLLNAISGAGRAK